MMKTMRILLGLMLVVASLPALAGADTPFWALTEEVCLKFYRPDGTEITSSNGNIRAFKEGLTDTTGQGIDGTFHTDGGCNCWCWSGLAPWYYFFVETTGPDTLLFPRYRFLGHSIAPDSSVTRNAIRDTAIVARHLADSTITGRKLAPRTITSENLADDAVPARALAPGAVDATTKLAPSVVLESAIAFQTFSEPYEFADTVGFRKSVTFDSVLVGTSAWRGGATWSNDALYDTLVVPGVRSTDWCWAQVSDISIARNIVACECRTDTVIVRISSSFGATGMQYHWLVVR
jgi:hypothetical protein